MHKNVMILLSKCDMTVHIHFFVSKKWVGRAVFLGVLFTLFFETGMNVLVKTKISYILEHVFN